MKIGSLFSGIGGLELGLERAGVGHVVWQVEQDEYCRAVLAKHWPDAQRFDDVRTVGAGTLAPADVICGGFPCQDISSAGRRAGIRGEQSGLWSEYVRIVRELRPRYVVVENVARLLADGMGVVLGELAESGYDAEWDCIPACAVGAPHERDRVFLVAYAVGVPVRQQSGRRNGSRRSRASDAQRDGAAGSMADAAGNGLEEQRLPAEGRQLVADTAGRRGMRKDAATVADAERWRRESGVQQRAGSSTKFAAALRGDRGGDCLRRAWESEPEVGRVAHGVPARLVEPELTALGNAVVPQVAEVVGRVLLQIHQELEMTDNRLTPTGQSENVSEKASER